MGLGFFWNNTDNKMKKILFFLTTLLPLAASAQLNGDGYYRIQNYATERYIVLNDSVLTGEIDMNSTSADVSNLATHKGFDNVKSNPASIFYIKNIHHRTDQLIFRKIYVSKFDSGCRIIDQ